jgi:hypothetical protein
MASTVAFRFVVGFSLKQTKIRFVAGPSQETHPKSSSDTHRRNSHPHAHCDNNDWRQSAARKDNQGVPCTSCAMGITKQKSMPENKPCRTRTSKLCTESRCQGKDFTIALKSIKKKEMFHSGRQGADVPANAQQKLSESIASSCL